MRRVAILLALSTLAACQEPPNNDAAAWGKNMGLDVTGASCMNMDQDGDGYVSCTLSVRSNGRVDILPIECASAYSPFAQGCRHQRASFAK